MGLGKGLLLGLGAAEGAVAGGLGGAWMSPSGRGWEGFGYGAIGGGIFGAGLTGGIMKSAGLRKMMARNPEVFTGAGGLGGMVTGFGIGGSMSSNKPIQRVPSNRGYR